VGDPGEKTIDLGPGGPTAPGEASEAKTGFSPQRTVPVSPAAGGLTGAPTPGAARASQAIEMKRPTIPEVEIEEEIGRGGMGVVFRGRQTYLDRRVAVKLLLAATGTGQKGFVDRFRREAKILAGLSHPNIVGCYQANQLPSGECYLVMEFIDGPNLRAWVEKSGPLSEVHALEVVRDTARALEHASASGIIHRDVKPENVLLQPVAEPVGAASLASGASGRRAAENRFPFTAKLVDLGLARPQMQDEGPDAGRITAEGVVMGTPCTMAPEQIDDPDHVDHRADIYGLGCVMYHILTGEPAFPQRNVTQILLCKARGDVPDPLALRPGLRKGVAALVTAMLQASREKRPQTYEEIIARCGALLEEAAASPKGVGTKRYYKAPDAKSGEVLKSPEAASRDAGVTPERAGAATAVDLEAEARAAAQHESRRLPAPARGGGSRGGLFAAIVIALVVGGGLLARSFLQGAGAPGGPSTSAGTSASATTSASSSTAASSSGATAATTPAPMQRVRFARAMPLVFPTKRLDEIFPGWEPKIGAATWTFEEDSQTGIQAIGAGARRLDLGAGSWKVEGAFVLAAGPEALATAPKVAGVTVHGAQSGVAVFLRNVGVSQAIEVRLVRRDERAPLGWVEDRSLLEKTIDLRKLGLKEEVPFALSLEGGVVHVEVADRSVAEHRLDGEAPTKLCLWSDAAKDAFFTLRDLKKALPAE